MLNLERNELLNAKLLSRSKKHTIDCWRLNDEGFDKLHSLYTFIVESCCASLDLNGHKSLPFYSKQSSLLDHDVSGQSIYCNPPWSKAIERVDHLRACHSRSPLDTKAVTILLD
jgi:hypothetical protein